YQSGTGFADLVLMPRKNTTTPAIIVELKYNDTTDTAIDQIHQRNYPLKVAEYTSDILLVAISYDRKTKEHQCEIERWRIGENCLSVDTAKRPEKKPIKTNKNKKSNLG
ncbi:MAG: PD-(D/E)XK nuclease domain-containing protein, partial [Prevotella sp.]|nr:PD-(D/E)XK nuclease domain-containing protein [Prevotella sp.]